MAPRGDRWEARPVLAALVRIAVMLVPLAVAVLVALLVVSGLPAPSGVAGHVAWWAAVLGCSYGAALLVERLARRALPLAVLLRLSLVFPDRAPSRLRAARRTSLRELERQVAELQATDEPAQAARTLVSLVGALGLHDRRTRGHSERVRAYVDLLTEEMGLPEEDRVRLRWAALLHDVGKLSVPTPVLNGGRDLSEQEWEVLRRHPLEGERLAAGLLPWLGPWGRCVREHHERWDGSGYPQGLRGTEISLGARIVAVADAFEVMTANRSYQQAIKATQAREELARCAGTDFDPAVVRAFLQVSLVRLRGVLGPLALLPALPLAALADRAGRVAQGLTTVAAVSTVALTAPVPAQLVPRPQPGPQHAEALPSPAALLPTAAAPVVAPRRPRVPPPVRPPARRAPAPVRTTAPAAAPTAVPAGLARTLYLSQGALSSTPPGSAVLPVPTGGTSFTAVAPGATPLDGGVRLVLRQQVQARHGRGRPSASLAVALADCGPAGCRPLAGTEVPLTRSRSGYVVQVVRLGPVRAVLPAGHALRLTLSLRAHANVTAVSLAVGGADGSRLLL